MELSKYVSEDGHIFDNDAMKYPGQLCDTFASPLLPFSSSTDEVMVIENPCRKVEEHDLKKDDDIANERDDRINNHPYFQESDALIDMNIIQGNSYLNSKTQWSIILFFSLFAYIFELVSQIFLNQCFILKIVEVEAMFENMKPKLSLNY